MGFSLEQIARLVNENVTAEQLQGMLTLKQAEIEREVGEGQARLARVAARLKQIEREGKLPQYEVVLKKVAPQRIASIRQVVPTLADMPRCRSTLYDQLYGWLAHNQIETPGPELAIYHNSEYTEQGIDMEVAVVVGGADPTGEPTAPDPVALRQLPAVEMMATVVHHGPPQDVTDAMVALYTWLGSNSCSTDSIREIHLFGRENDLMDYGPIVIEVQVPVSPLDSHVG